MKKKRNGLVLFFELSLMILFLLGTLRAETALAASSNSTKDFSISSSSDFTKKASINNLLVNVNQVFPIYFYATNGGNTQCPAVLQDIPLSVTLIDPNNQPTSYNIIIPEGPANTYGILPDISCDSSGDWTVKVSGNPGKGNVIVTGTFTVVGSNQASLNVIPAEATIPLGSTQQFEALFTNGQETSSPADASIPDAFNYALFSGSSTSTLLLNGSSSTINGNAHSNSNFRANGANLTVTGRCEAVTTVNVNGSNIQIGEIVEQAPSINMPDFSDIIKTQADTAGQTYNGNITYNGSNINVESSIYVNGNLTITGSRFSGKGTIVATGNIIFNGSNLNVANDDSVCFYSKNGNITINGANANLNGIVYAPNGTITMNGAHQTIKGRVVGNIVTMNGSGLNIISSDNDLDSIPTSGQLVWSSDNQSVASISSTGLATGNGVGTCTITATYTINDVTYTDTAQLTIVNFSITPTDKIVSLGFTQQYRANLTDSAGNVTDVTQSVNQWSIISLGLELATISTSGLATAKGLGTCLIQATYIINGVSISASTSVTILKPTLSLTSSSTMLGVDNTQPYLATLTDCDMNQSNVTTLVTWSSDNQNVATVDPATGIATGVGLGTCTITGTYIINDVSIIATTPLKIVKLSITPANTTISLGMTLQIKAEFTDSDGTMTDVPIQSSSVSWTSDKPSVATIDVSSGLVTSAGVGTCTITGTYSIDGASIIATTPLKIVSLSITPASTTISSGMTQQYKAEFTDSDGVTTNITSRATWVSSKVNVATIEAGLATGVGGGTSTITVTDSVTKVSGTVVLTVLPTMNISTTTTTPILPGDTQQLEAQLVYVDRDNIVVTTTANWVSSNVGVATIGLNTGTATGIGGGTVTITVTDPVTGVSGTVSLEVLPTLRITSSTLRMAPGESIDFSAQLIYADSTENQDITNRVTWESSNFIVASFGLVGNVTAHSGGVCTITARDAVTELSKTAVLTVTPVLSVTPPDATISPGASQQFVAQLIYFDGPKPTQVSWSSSVPAVATIDSSGSALGVGGGISIITATDLTGLNKTVSLTVLPRLSITLTTSNLIPGASLPLKAELVYVDGTPSQDITTSAEWSSNDETVCTVSATGNLTALTSGTCTITALDQDTAVSGSVTVTVMAPNQLRITPANLAPLSIGGNVQLTATLVYPDDSTKEIINPVTWVSSNISVATVDSTGKLTGMGGGHCVITATESDSGLSLIGNLTVTVLPTVIISPSSRAILIGDNLTYKAELIYSDGTLPEDVTSGVTWNSSNSEVASITPSGIATGIGDGSCTINASFNDSPSNSAYLTVAPTSNIEDLIIIPDPVSQDPLTPDTVVDAIFVGDTLQFKAQWLFANGTRSDVLNSVVWQSDIEMVATIDNEGLVTGIAAGTSTISGTITVNGNQWKGKLLLTVLPPKGGIIRASEQ